MSLTVPTQASALRNNGYMCINNIPCRIIDTTRSKTGKHGGMKIHFSAVDIFTDQRHDHLQMSTQNIDVPYVTKNEYQLVDIDDNIVSYLDDKGSLLNDLFLPNLSKSDPELSQEIRDNFDAGKEISITVISAMGITAIKGFRITNMD